MKSDRSLSVEEKITIKRMHKNKRTFKYIANALNKTIKEITEYVHNQMPKEKPVIFTKDRYTPTGRELQPSYKSECITIVSNNKMVVEDYLKRFGKRIEPIKMALSERQRAWNMHGVIFGSSFYTKKL